MEPSSTPEPQPVTGSGSGRRWLVLPIVLVAFVALAIVKPWSDDRTSSTPPRASAATAPRAATATSTPPTAVVTTALPAATTVLGSFDVGPIPWANESAADALGVWSWSDTGIVTRVAVGSTSVTQIDLGRPPDVAGPLGSRGIALAWSQLWASDPAHRGLARIDRETGAVAERIELWSEAEAAQIGAGGTTSDRWAGAWGFAVDGDSIFVPSIAARQRGATDPAGPDGEVWRVDTASDRTPGWIPVDHPTGVAVGFGAVWVVSCCGDQGDSRTYSIIRLEQETGGVQATIRIPVSESVADGRPVLRIGHDSVWVGLPELPLIVRIDPATNGIRSTIATDLPVTDLAVDDDGTIWVTESEAWYRFGAVASDRCEGRLVRLDPVREGPMAATAMACPMSVAVAGNDVWVGSAGTEPSSTGGVPPRLVHLRAIDPPG